MQPSSNLGHLKTADWESVQDLVTRFEDACQGGEIAKLEQFLLPEGNPMRVLALIELIKSDLEIRWSRRKRILLEEYLKRFRELEAHPSHLPKLLYEEYRVRLKFNDKPVLADYAERFPKHFRALEKIVAEHTQPPKPPPGRTPDAEDPGTATVAHLPGTAPVPPVAPVPVSSDEPATKPPGRKDAVAEAGPKAAGRVPPDVGNGYKCIVPLGSGTFGQVWRGEAPGGVPCAIKIIFRPIDHEEAKRELQALEKIRDLRHRTLALTQAFWQHGDRLIIIMQLADCSLRDRAKECRQAGLGCIPVEELLEYFKDAAEGLDYLHERDLLHRDIKPDNLLLVKSGVKSDPAIDKSQRTTMPGMRAHLVLGDFGLVRLFESQRMQASGAGTPAYMPPEVWNGQISKHSDQYSLAITYGELRRGKPVFAGTNMYELMVEALQKDPDLSGLEPAEQEVLRKALDKEPTKRYESCLEFAHALERAFVPPAPPPVMPSSSGQSSDPGATWDGPEVGTIVAHPGPDSVRRHSKPSWRRDTEPDIDVQPPAPRKRSLLPTLLLVLVACGLVGSVVYSTIIRSGGQGEDEEVSYSLDSPNPVTVHAGDSTPIVFHVHRKRFNRPITLTFSNLPKGVQLKAQEIPPNEDEVHAEITSEFQAPACSTTVTIRAAAQDQEKTATFTLHVNTYGNIWRPDWSMVPGAKLVKEGDRTFYDKIDVLRDGTACRFLAIQHKSGRTKDVSSFYIMENKVSVGQYKVFAKSSLSKRYFLPYVTILLQQQPLAAVTCSGYFVTENLWQEAGDVGGDYPQDDYPVFNVRVDDAYEFARWLGGNLPTIDQWDVAAGRYEMSRGEGPYKGQWKKEHPLDIAVNRKREMGPMRCGAAKDDVSRFGCHDMAGNGREWTRNLDRNGQMVPYPNPVPLLDNVLLRGRSFVARMPLQFNYQEEELGENAPIAAYKEPKFDVGFRVVIEIN